MNLANKIERRKHSRSQVRWPIAVLTDHGSIKGETRNIAAYGIYIFCEEPLRLNEIFAISIRPPDHEIIEAAGKVIWPNLYGVDAENTALYRPLLGGNF